MRVKSGRCGGLVVLLQPLHRPDTTHAPAVGSGGAVQRHHRQQHRTLASNNGGVS